MLRDHNNGDFRTNAIVTTPEISINIMKNIHYEKEKQTG